LLGREFLAENRASEIVLVSEAKACKNNSHHAAENDLLHERDEVNNAPVLESLYQRNEIVEVRGA
jgi:hypothetical protein